ncbi:hypothetical protein T07_12588 [Trichinella nelsoni]|uniref:Secreted protein n=1 Tax=Trichinella nelsoni TaxID=6336 RepID=A0A0V0RZS9_9BILA|nr:hypothetical protein T07_12588 [Trichinella nelsoni]
MLLSLGASLFVAVNSTDFTSSGCDNSPLDSHTGFYPRRNHGMTSMVRSNKTRRQFNGFVETTNFHIMGRAKPKFTDKSQ